MPTFIIKTLGCKVNQYETQMMRENLLGNGFAEKKEGDVCDVYIINSCTVTQKADKETRNLIRRFHKVNPRGKIAIAGCYAELDSDRDVLRSIPGVRHLIRNNEKERIAHIIGQSSGRVTSRESRVTDFKGRDRAFIKIQDGCNQKCSYCKINLVRGPSRSRCVDEILKEAELLIRKDFKEIVLTGICLGAWGTDFGRKINLAYLINEISKSKGLFRVRLSSIEPVYVSDDLIGVIKENKKVCEHLHIPLQSGDDRILRLMKRPYSAKKFARLIAGIRKKIPDMAFTTDVLVGFPGETEGHFLNTYEFIKRIKPSRMHVFPYSKREGTAAAKYKNTISKKTARERVKKLMELGKRLSIEFAESFLGKKDFLLVESQRDRDTALLCGYTPRYIRVLLDGEDALKNSIVPVTISSVDREKNLILGRLDNG